MSIIGALKAAKAGEKVRKTAPFYSFVDETLANLKRNKGTGAEFLTEVMKTKGVKPAEIADRKLEQAFKGKGKMTKQEAQQILKDNPPPQVEDRHLREISDYERDKMLEEKLETSGYDYMGEVPPRKILSWNDEIDQDLEKYGDYKTVGGENYREILLKLPQAFTNKEASRIMAIEADLRRGEIPEKQMQELIALKNKQQTAQPDYRTSHWKEDPNVLAHMRVQDRKGPNGEKILHVEEIQSDWHQAGRKKGYRNQEALVKAQTAFDDYNKDARERLRQIMLKESEGEMAPDRAQTYVDNFVNGMDPSGVAGFLNEKTAFNDLYRATKGVGGSDVPDAPFKKNWHELAMKRLLNYAADNGYDSIAISPGAEQFRRYGSERIDWKKGDDGWTVGAKEQSGGEYGGQNIEEIARERGVLLERGGDPVKTKEDLHRIVSIVMRRDNSKEQIDKLTDRVWDRMQTEPEGTSLPRKEGMEGFYDKMLTDYLNTYGDKYGAKVEMGRIPVSTRDPKDTSWGGGMRGDHPFITVQDLNEPFDGMVDLMRRNDETGEESLVGRMLRADSERLMAEELQKLDTYNQIKLHNFPITPEMRESIKQKGLPLYQQVGIPTAGAGVASQMLEPQEEPEYSKGGSIAKMAALAKMKKLKEEMAPRAEAVKSLIARDQNRYLADVAPNSLTNAEIQAEIKRMAARAKASGQQEGVLPRAERDANLAKMLEQSEIQNRLYHGTTDDVPRFDPNTAGKKTGNLTTALGTFLSDNPAESSRYAELWGTEGGNVMPVFAQLKNPYVMPYSEYNKLAMGAWNRRMKDPDYDPNQIIKFGDVEAQKRASEALKKHEEAGLQDVIKRRNELIEQGHDSIVINIGGDREIIVFDPNKIKSATGNRGTYDINDPDVNKAKGGLVKPKVKDSKSGKVRMTENRDTMFIELSNKKLKRK